MTTLPKDIIERVQKVIETEKACVVRNKVRDCTIRNCGECDLCLDSDEIILAYNVVLSLLAEMRGDEK